MIEFISYTGKWPNLCSGVLTLRIDGKEVSFGHEPGSYDVVNACFKDNNYAKFWRSGGGVYNRGNYNFEVEEGEWEYNGCLPEEYEPYAEQFMTVMNKNVECGCCGGCI